MKDHYFRTPSPPIINEDIHDFPESEYLTFKTSWLKLMTGRFFGAFCSILISFFGVVILLVEVMGMGFIMDWVNDNLWGLLGVLLIASYINFFWFNYTFQVNNKRVIVYRQSFKGSKEIGEYPRSNHRFQFKTDHFRGVTYHNFVVIENKPTQKKRRVIYKQRAFHHGLSKSKREEMSVAIENMPNN